jgi:hypothetical protein
LLNVGLHLRIIGRPARFWALDKFLDDLAALMTDASLCAMGGLTPLPVLSVAAPRSTTPAPVSVPRDWSPPSCSVAPLATASVGWPVRRCAAPRARVPLSTATVVAGAPATESRAEPRS